MHGFSCNGEIYGLPAVKVFKEIRQQLVEERNQDLIGEPDIKQLTDLF